MYQYDMQSYGVYDETRNCYSVGRPQQGHVGDASYKDRTIFVNRHRTVFDTELPERSPASAIKGPQRRATLTHATRRQDIEVARRNFLSEPGGPNYVEFQHYDATEGTPIIEVPSEYSVGSTLASNKFTTYDTVTSNSYGTPSRRSTLNTGNKFSIKVEEPLSEPLLDTLSISCRTSEIFSDSGTDYEPQVSEKSNRAYKNPVQIETIAKEYVGELLATPYEKPVSKPIEQCRRPKTPATRYEAPPPQKAPHTGYSSTNVTSLIINPTEYVQVQQSGDATTRDEQLDYRSEMNKRVKEMRKKRKRRCIFC